MRFTTGLIASNAMQLKAIIIIIIIIITALQKSNGQTNKIGMGDKTNK